MIAVDPYNTGDRKLNWGTNEQIAFDKEIITQYQSYFSKISQLASGSLEEQYLSEDMEMAAPAYLMSLVRKKYPGIKVSDADAESAVLVEIPEGYDFMITHARNGNEECVLFKGEEIKLAKIIPWY